MQSTTNGWGVIRPGRFLLSQVARHNGRGVRGGGVAVAE